MAAKTASLSVNIIADAAKARAGLKEAETAFGKFSREVGNAQGAMGKFRTISGSAFDYVKANAVSFATAAATAIGAFAVKSVMAFQDLALSAGKFADATGLSTQEASRFIEVAGDIGIEAGQVEKAIGFMNKTLGNSPELFKAFGVEIAYAADGSRNANDTFLNVVDRLNQIKDPAERAAVATKLLGRGWMEMSELIGMGADQLAASLGAVSDAKVIDPAEVARAREMRAAMDELRDKFEDLTLQLGEKLVPAITDSIDLFLALSDAVGNIPVLPDIFENMLKGRPFHMALTEAVIDLGREIMGVNSEVDLSAASFEGMGVGLGFATDQMRDASLQTQEMTTWLQDQIEEVDRAKEKWDEFRNGLSIKSQTLSVIESIDEFRKKWAGATEEAKGNSREYQGELLKNQAALASLALSITGLATTAQNTQIRFAIDTGRLEYAWSLIQLIQLGLGQSYQNMSADAVERAIAARGGLGGTPGVQKYVPPPPSTAPKAPAKSSSPQGSNWYNMLMESKIKNIKGIATGGTITAGGMALVGEDGPELVNLPRSASVIPSIPSRKMLGSGMTVNVSVQAGLVSSPDQVGQQIIDAIRRAERRSGQVFAGL